MSRVPLWDLGRDVSVAVVAYIGIARDQFWSWLANDGYSLRLAEYMKRCDAADRLAEKESQTEVFEPEDIWAAEERQQRVAATREMFRKGFWCHTCRGLAEHCGGPHHSDDACARYMAYCERCTEYTGAPHGPVECRCPSCLDVLEAEQESSPAADEDTASAGSPSFSGLSGGADWARGSSRAATAAGEPASVAARQRTEEAGAPRPPVGAPAIPNAERVGTLWEHFPRVHTEGGIACRCNKRFWASVDWSRHALAALDEAVNK